MKYHIIIYCLMLVMLMSDCTKKPSTNSNSSLPPATHIGANVVACYVNGKVFKASMYSSNLFVRGVDYSMGDSFVVIFATVLDPHYNIEMGSKYQTILGTYAIEQTPIMHGAEYDDFTNSTLPTGNNTFLTDSTHTGTITYTYYDGNILAGTFQFDAVNGAGQIAHITDGRFDIAKH